MAFPVYDTKDVVLTRDGDTYYFEADVRDGLTEITFDVSHDMVTISVKAYGTITVSVMTGMVMKAIQFVSIICDHIASNKELSSIQTGVRDMLADIVNISIAADIRKDILDELVERFASR